MAADPEGSARTPEGNPRRTNVPWWCGVCRVLLSEPRGGRGRGVFGLVLGRRLWLATRSNIQKCEFKRVQTRVSKALLNTCRAGVTPLGQNAAGRALYGFCVYYGVVK